MFRLKIDTLAVGKSGQEDAAADATDATDATDTTATAAGAGAAVAAGAGAVVAVGAASAAAKEGAGAVAGAGEDDADEAEEKSEYDRAASPAHLQFVTGNPRVEIIPGLLHLYRCHQPLVPPGKSAMQSKLSPDLMAKSIAKGVKLPWPRSDRLCIIAVPSHMSVSDLVLFMASFREHVQVIRILRDTAPYKYMALLQFDEQSKADEFYIELNNTKFNSLEPEVCRIVFVSDVEFDGSSNPPTAFDGTSSNCTELPTCPVCLERLDSSVSGVLTTVCNHSFHSACLTKWEDSSCPVCRYCQSMGSEISNCEVCGSSKSLWICLICGFIGCGRYAGEHAVQHFNETMHAYSLELETQRVWDYAGDGYVHRLIWNQADGKLVEFHHPDHNSGERSQVPTFTDADEQESEMSSKKMESVALQYSFLLTSQLEEQRHYYEQKIAVLHQQHAVAKEGEKKQSQRREEKLEAKVEKFEKENQFLRDLNRSLVKDRSQWTEKIEQVEAEKQEAVEKYSAKVEELEAQVRDLMFYLDTQQKVEKSPQKEQIQEGAMLISQSEEGQRKRRGGKKKKK